MCWHDPTGTFNIVEKRSQIKKPTKIQKWRTHFCERKTRKLSADYLIKPQNPPSVRFLGSQFLSYGKLPFSISSQWAFKMLTIKRLFFSMNSCFSLANERKDDTRTGLIVENNSTWLECSSKIQNTENCSVLKVVEIQTPPHTEIWDAPVDCTVVALFGPLFNPKFTIRKFRIKMQAFATTSIFHNSRSQSH